MDVGQELVDTRSLTEVNVLQGSAAILAPETVSPPAPPTSLDVPVAPSPSKQIEAEPPADKRLGRILAELKWPVGVYACSRIGLFLVALACDALFGSVVRGNSLGRELSNWDGWWYIRVATLGYHSQVSHAQTTLGFFPLYPMVMWLVAHVFFSSYLVAGLVISGLGGLVATVLVQRLATEWWGPNVARKAVLLFCVFPGTVVFSMDYSEGLLIPLLAGCLLALGHRRWLLAGVLAGLASGIGPDALVVVPMCAAASLSQLRRHGWRDRGARHSLIAPLLAPFGAAGFAVFLWAWTGTPFASYIAQKDGWHESSNPLAIPNQALMLVHEIGIHFHWYHINVNVVVGLLGTVFLVVGLRWLWRDRNTLPLEVLVFTASMALLMVTSEHVPPNPRLLITAFPVVLIFARRLRGRAWTQTIWITGGALVLLSALTFVGSVLRP
ncbi:MAG: hypothetical protein ACYCSF_01100 [Acidimicrobiales bacterium]